jgi:hypothetical protein
MYTFRVNTLQRQSVRKTPPKEINKKQEQVKEIARQEQVKEIVCQEQVNEKNKIVAPVKTVSGIAHLFKK